MLALEKANLVDATKRSFRLNPAEDDGLANALRVCEETFNADALPQGIELMAPCDFYAAIAFGRSRTRPRARDEGVRLFPYLAA
ncbi:hypothetical protein [Bradyrhizobium iriomotense]|uniref:hypothetical protein n=1 Tax=Bradyrhizobium iriomotense TaxID=441950 RepID=UPI001B8A4BE8|nr:hypothetical protein [Bradyrhizobium iriomotense]MBR1133065.1 hypothetical protein [Bradyrhizobium iriomotense]